MWDSIPVEQGFVCWTDDMFARLKIYQALDGEKRGLEVLNPWWFDAPRIRREFTARHGFDPMEGITLRPDMILPADPAHKGEGPRADLLLLRDAICQGINEKSPLPVLIFDPERRSLRLLTKPAPGDSARTG